MDLTSEATCAGALEGDTFLPWIRTAMHLSLMRGKTSVRKVCCLRESIKTAACPREKLALSVSRAWCWNSVEEKKHNGAMKRN